jgi:CRP-like cAMP-binding protein
MPFSHPFRNKLLAKLAPDDVALLEPSLQLVDLEVRAGLEKANMPIEHIYFIEDGIASVVAASSDGRTIEAGLIGSDGMTGSAVVLGDDRSPNETYMQVAGSAWRIPTSQLQRALSGSAALRPRFLRYVHVLLIQAAHTALANGQFRIEERLARWLLMVHDRIDGDRLHLTHEFLAIMLGVRRPGVTEALNRLEDRGMIKSRRAQVLIVDRAGLEHLAHGAYGVPEEQYRRLMEALP